MNLDKLCCKAYASRNEAPTITSYLKKFNGSKIIIGPRDGSGAYVLFVNRRFNWFQKKMIKWCFGFYVEDCTEKE